MLFNISNLLLLVILCFKFTNTKKSTYAFSKILIVKSLTNPENPVSDETLEVPRRIFSEEEEAESYVIMLENNLKFEKKLKLLLRFLIKKEVMISSPSLTIENEYQAIFKFGVHLYNFEKKLEANFLKYNLNSEKRGTFLVQPNKEVTRENENFWDCEKIMISIKINEVSTSSFLCLLMIYKVRILIAKAHPDIPKVQWQPTTDAFDSERLNRYDEERIYIFQNKERK
ncbi:hypothetical protein HMI54_014667 [Coelomomyces lativittatus]|nr:hypothetical protein HMI54_014667 [Coelomomyces lativittatus]KAJ1518216.1 hypothetical protein HMI55_001497 [Coelomomyces lativittatus]